jgi:hypothetical protein
MAIGDRRRMTDAPCPALLCASQVALTVPASHSIPGKSPRNSSSHLQNRGRPKQCQYQQAQLCRNDDNRLSLHIDEF